MGANTGVNMLRVLGVLTTAALVATARSERTTPRAAIEPAAPASVDVSALLAAARGAPPVVCGLAAR
jgi:hypothetical protein